MTEKEFISRWNNELKGGVLKQFPDDFIQSTDCALLTLPRKSLVLGAELFGSYEILDTDGNLQLQINNLVKAKYIIYANRNKPVEILIPRKEEEILMTVKSYERHLDTILAGISRDYKIAFPDGKNSLQVSNIIFKSLNIIRL